MTNSNQYQSQTATWTGLVRLAVKTSFLLSTLLGMTAAADAADKPEYNRDILPILAENCFACHGPDRASRKAGLRLDQREAALQAGALVPGDPGSSLLVERILSADPGQAMPPARTGKKLTEVQKELLRQWVVCGAEYQPHWSFIPPRRPSLPEVNNPTWVRNPIDRFILAELEKRGLQPAVEADRRTLARRLSLDLTGLIPIPEEVDAFVNDTSPAAYEHLVASFLQSPHWAEHRARYWLDAARFAETRGLFTNERREHWRYRDWVINAFSRNQPFDHFTIEQLAGDLLPHPTLQQKIATGFNRSHMTTSESVPTPEEYLVQYVRDQIETTAEVWLGLTIACAVCHDHKFDPLTTQDFYSLAAFFNNTTQAVYGNQKGVPATIPLISTADSPSWETLPARLARVNWKKSWFARLGWVFVGVAGLSLVARIFMAVRLRRCLPPSGRVRVQGWCLAITFLGLTPLSIWLLLASRACKGKLENLQKEREAILARSPVAPVMEESDKEPEAYVLFRGEYDKRRERVKARTPASLPSMPAELPRNRLGFARWLFLEEQPLTARVIVNRFWQEVFGTGLVCTPGDFGLSGETPSHRELLDWLAVEFRESGWDVKKFFTLLVTSATYRQSALATPEKRALDPHNRLLGRGPRFRMDAEMIRDSALAASGLLVRTIGGPSVHPYQPSGVWEAVGVVGSDTHAYHQDTGENLYRRSLYTFWNRCAPPPSLFIFNAPTRETCTVCRDRTNTPLQALVTLNDVQFIEAARSLAQKCLKEGGIETASRLDFVARRLLSRSLSAEEQQVLLPLLSKLRAHYQTHTEDCRKLLMVGESRADASLDTAALAAWTMVVNELMNIDEFLCK